MPLRRILLGMANALFFGLAVFAVLAIREAIKLANLFVRLGDCFVVARRH